MSFCACNCVFKPVCGCMCVCVSACCENCLALSWFQLALLKKTCRDTQGFINNHWPHEKLIHSGLENRQYFPRWYHVDVRHLLKSFSHSVTSKKGKRKKDKQKLLECYCFIVHVCIKENKRDPRHLRLEASNDPNSSSSS